MLDSLWPRLRQKIVGRGHRVVLVEPEDPRVLSAAAYLVKENLAVPLLVGNAVRIGGVAQEMGVDLRGMECLDPASHGQRNEFLKTVLDLRGSKGVSEAQAKELVSDPLYFGVMTLRSGLGDSLVGGAVRTSAETVRAGFSWIGTAKGAAIAFGAFLMECPHADGGTRTLLLADCAVSPHPSPRALATVAVAAARLFERFVEEPAYVAFLSFSTFGSAFDESVVDVRHAAALAKEKDPGVAVVGEIQADAALVPWIARQKGVQGMGKKANVLIFPDLNAGNIGYKLLQYLGGARAVGPLVVGLAKPFSDLSRGCTDEDIVDATVLTALL